jgi:transcriptional regulator with XRE-family HTH domain
VATDLGARLKAARKHLGWSLREAERRSGVPNAHISQVETGGIKSPGTAVLVRLSAAYEVPLAELLTLAGHVSFGEVGDDGRLEDVSNHDMWTLAVWLPKGREGEVVEWMNAHGICVYRMWQPQEIARTGR